MARKKPPDVLCRKCGGEMMLIETASLTGQPEAPDEITYICDGCDTCLRRRVVHGTTQIVSEKWQFP